MGAVELNFQINEFDAARLKHDINMRICEQDVDLFPCRLLICGFVENLPRTRGSGIVGRRVNFV